MLKLNTMELILKKHGAKRVSLDAKQALKELLEKYASELSIKSIKLAKHAKRTTIRKEDIMLSK